MFLLKKWIAYLVFFFHVEFNCVVITLIKRIRCLWFAITSWFGCRNLIRRDRILGHRGGAAGRILCGGTWTFNSSSCGSTCRRWWGSWRWLGRAIRLSWLISIGSSCILVLAWARLCDSVFCNVTGWGICGAPPFLSIIRSATIITCLLLFAYVLFLATLSTTLSVPILLFYLMSIIIHDTRLFQIVATILGFLAALFFLICDWFLHDPHMHFETPALSYALIIHDPEFIISQYFALEVAVLFKVMNLSLFEIISITWDLN